MTNNLLDPPPDDHPVGALTGTGTPAESAVHATTWHSTVEFELFYRAEAAALVRFLVWMGASLPDAADAAQDSMMEAFQRWTTIRIPRAWIRRVASRTFLRRQLARLEQPTADIDGRPLLPAGADLSDWEQHEEVRRLLAELPPRQRQVMAWTFDGYPPQEIATELGIPAETVRGSLKLARRALAQRLPEHGGPR